MDRDTALTVGLALLAVIALGVAAATIDTAVTTSGSDGFGGGDGEGSGIGPDDPDRPFGTDRSGGETQIEPLVSCIPELREPPALIGLAVLVAAVFGLTYRDTGSAFASGAVAFALSIPIGLVWLLFAICTAGTNPRDADGSWLGIAGDSNESFFGEAGGSSGLGETAAETVTTPTAVFTMFVVVAILASVVLLLTAGSDDEPDGVSSAPDDETDETDVVQLGRTAGDAADRIEADADVDNEVFVAWREMTEELDVTRPASSTPAEFADAAVAAGMDRERVSALTDLFEEVRYGGAEPTPDRERRAIDALRAIEATYAEGE